VKPIDVVVKREGPVVVVRLVGDLELTNQAAVRAKIDPLLAEGASVVLDLEALDYIDSSGLGFIIGTLKRIRECNGRLALARPKPHVAGIFKLINLPSLVGIHPTLEAALETAK